MGIAAPAGPFGRGRFLRAVRNLERFGFRVSYRRDIFTQNGYLAGSDQRRARELNAMLVDPTISALLFARGGFGTQRLLPQLKKIHPKVVIGSSDLTCLLVALWQRWRLPSLYGPMVAPHLGDPLAARRLARILTHRAALTSAPLVASKVLKGGRAAGRLVGGCLSLLVSMVGTPDEPDTHGAILFLEDTDEPPYAVDRLLTQWEQAGKWRGVRGVVLGTFCLRGRLFPREVEAVFRKRLASIPGPVLWGVRFGHCQRPVTLPFGGWGRVVGRRLWIEKGIFHGSA